MRPANRGHGASARALHRSRVTAQRRVPGWQDVAAQLWLRFPLWQPTCSALAFAAEPGCSALALQRVPLRPVPAQGRSGGQSPCKRVAPRRTRLHACRPACWLASAVGCLFARHEAACGEGAAPAWCDPLEATSQGIGATLCGSEGPKTAQSKRRRWLRLFCHRQAQAFWAKAVSREFTVTQREL